MTIEFLGILGPFGIGVVLFTLGRISGRFGRVTQTNPYHLGLYYSAVLAWLGALAQCLDILYDFTNSSNVTVQTLWIFLRNGLPALGVTVGLLIVWYYWSWLLAERD